MIRIVGSCLIAGAVIAAHALANENLFAIEVTVVGAEPGTGQVLISLFDSSQSYLVEPALEATVDVDARGSAFASLGVHAPGEYAITVIYDKNKNGELDTGWFRIPKEEIGFQQCEGTARPGEVG